MSCIAHCILLLALGPTDLPVATPVSTVEPPRYEPLPSEQTQAYTPPPSPPPTPTNAPPTPTPAPRYEPPVAPARSPNQQPTPGSAIPADELKDLTGIGFQQFADVSRVFVRTSDPVEYQVRRHGRIIELILQNTRIPVANNTRFLDTSFFDSPVRWIQPKIIEDPSASVRIMIYLNNDANKFNEVKKDTTLALDFSRDDVE